MKRRFFVAVIFPLLISKVGFADPSWFAVMQRLQATMKAHPTVKEMVSILDQWRNRVQPLGEKLTQSLIEARKELSQSAGELGKLPPANNDEDLDLSPDSGTNLIQLAEVKARLEEVHQQKIGSVNSLEEKLNRLYRMGLRSPGTVFLSGEEESSIDLELVLRRNNRNFDFSYNSFGYFGISPVAEHKIVSSAQGEHPVSSIGEPNPNETSYFALDFLSIDAEKVRQLLENVPGGLALEPELRPLQFRAEVEGTLGNKGLRLNTELAFVGIKAVYRKKPSAFDTAREYLKLIFPQASQAIDDEPIPKEDEILARELLNR